MRASLPTTPHTGDALPVTSRTPACYLLKKVGLLILLALCAGGCRAWGAETRSSCCGGDLVFVDEAAEQIASPRPKMVRLRVGSHG
jgi:hypothetical protein